MRPGIDVSGAPLLESNATNAILLKALCEGTVGCAGFTVGSGGGEPGDFPPHDCRGSRLYTAESITSSAHSHSGVDLFIFGAQPAVNATAVTPKPAMQRFPPGKTVRSLVVRRGSFRISVAGGATDELLLAAAARYERLTFVGNEERTDRAETMAVAEMLRLDVNVSFGEADAPLALFVDESYSLTVQAGAGTLSAPTIWGALRGLETWSQLVVRAADGAHLADEQIIEDAPQYAYRGLMIDTARHYLPLALIFATLDGMAYEKMNVLHWHAVDDQSFPLDLPSLPKLASAGAFAPDLIYSAENISAVIAYA